MIFGNELTRLVFLLLGMLIHFLFGQVKASIESGPTFSDPNYAYRSTQTYQEIQDFFKSVDYNEICEIVHEFSKTPNKTRMEEWVAEHPGIKDQFNKSEELGRTLIYVDRNSRESEFFNGNIQNRKDCWMGYREGLTLGTGFGNHKYSLPSSNTNKYLQHYFHGIFCPEHTALRGKSENGIVCSRYPPIIQEGVPIKTYIQNSGVEGTIECNGAAEGGEKIHCLIEFGEEIIQLCQDIYSLGDHHTIHCGKTGIDICGAGQTVTGLLLPNLPNITTHPHPINICGSNFTLTDAPIEGLTEVATEGTEEVLNAWRLRRFVLSMHGCDKV